MKIKISEATPLQLDWLVTKIEWPSQLHDFFMMHDEGDFHYSTSWKDGGQIIERERISIDQCFSVGRSDSDEVYASIPVFATVDKPRAVVFGEQLVMAGLTPLIAAMRCYVASKLGDEVEVPKELS